MFWKYLKNSSLAQGQTQTQIADFGSLVTRSENVETKRIEAMKENQEKSTNESFA